MNGLEYRLKEFFLPGDGRCLIVDASAGLVLGALPGLDDFERGVKPILSMVDGLVCSPGQLRRLSGKTKGEAGLLVRMDWTNALRGREFVLPPTQAKYVSILQPRDALDIGAVGMVNTFLLGYEEEIDADCLYNTVQLALQGKKLGLPLVVEVRTDGPRVSLPGKAVELGASYALESGADVIAIPYPGSASLKTIAEFVHIPWLIKPRSLMEAVIQAQEALELGCAGLWFDHTVFTQPDPASVLLSIKTMLHSPATA